MRETRSLWMRDLTPARHAAIATAVSEMFLGFPSMRSVRADEAKQMTAKYVKELEDLPQWAIDEACQRITRGSVIDASADFPPSSARVRIVALDVVQPLRSARETLLDALRAELPPREISDEERAEMAAKFAALRDQLAATARMLDAQDRAEASSRSRELAAKRNAVLTRQDSTCDSTPSKS